MTIGTSLPHDSAVLHVTGQARYTDDLPAPGHAVHLAFGLSDVAKGAITAMDLAAVRAAPGVVAVLVAVDLVYGQVLTIQELQILEVVELAAKDLVELQ